MIGRQNLTDVTNLQANARRVVVGISRPALVLTLAALFPVVVGAQTNSRPNAKAFIVTISEARVDNEHGVTSTDCLLVRLDGRLHLERRRQAPVSPTAMVKIFESSLDASQLERLQGIVKSEETSRLPEYEKQSVFFQNASWFSSVAVDVSTGEATRRFGYWLWDERNPGPGVPADVRKQWQDVETGLRPMVEWFHGIVALNLPPSASAPTQCSPNEP
jgi:hypothetical protein